MKKLTLTDLGFQFKDNLLLPQFCECGCGQQMELQVNEYDAKCFLYGCFEDLSESCTAIAIGIHRNNNIFGFLRLEDGSIYEIEKTLNDFKKWEILSYFNHVAVIQETKKDSYRIVHKGTK